MTIKEHIEAIRDHAATVADAHTAENEARLFVAITAALAACDESPWRPIETAPKDDEALFVNSDGLVVCGLLMPGATHRMPLPAAPGEKENPNA